MAYPRTITPREQILLEALQTISNTAQAPEQAARQAKSALDAFHLALSLIDARHAVHNRRSSHYTLLGLGIAQCSKMVIGEGDTVISYRDAYGLTWHRHIQEFMDGRFTLQTETVPTKPMP